MKTNYFCLLSFFISMMAFCQVGIGTTDPNPSSVLDLTSTNKALLLPRIANTSLITSPTNGMIIYDISSNCIRAYENNAWSNCIGGTTEASSNGTSKISFINCSAGISGTLTVGSPANNVTQTVTIDVTQIGTYNIASSSNGVTFSASGNLSSLGIQNIVLTASGTPLAVATPSFFTLNVSPGCVFARNVNAAGSLSTVGCHENDFRYESNLLAVNEPAIITQTITIVPSTTGSYTISGSDNGVTMSASGTFSASEVGIAKDIVLTASGSPFYSIPTNTLDDVSCIFPIVGFGSASGLNCTFRRIIWANCPFSNVPITVSNNFAVATGSFNLNSLITNTSIPAGSTGIAWWKYEPGLGGIYLSSLDGGTIVPTPNGQSGEALTTAINVTQSGVYVPFFVNGGTCFTSRNTVIIVTIN